jgi:UDP-N-acetyl-2-amino-2-deoxyglucuronate dehydrogenase
MKHRIVLIGHGGIAKSYAGILAGMPHAEVCGVVGRDSARAQAFAAEHGIAAWGTDVAEVAASAQATAAIVCTPNGAHYEGVMAAAAAGLHCLCEKPLAIEPEQADAMIAACRDRGVKLSVSYMRRFTEHVQRLRAAVEAGRLGRITVVDVTLKHFRPAAYYNSWHGTKSMDGGGPFIQQGSHIVDMAVWLCGGYDRVLQAACFRTMHEIETEDHGYAVVSYRNGAIGMIEASTACVGVSQERIELSGTLGSVMLDFNGIVACTVPGLMEELIAPAHAAGGDQLKLMGCLLADFLDAIEQDREPFITGESAAAATKLINDIYAAAGSIVARPR